MYILYVFYLLMFFLCTVVLTLYFSFQLFHGIITTCFIVPTGNQSILRDVAGDLVRIQMNEGLSSDLHTGMENKLTSSGS